MSMTPKQRTREIVEDVCARHRVSLDEFYGNIKLPNVCLARRLVINKLYKMFPEKDKANLGYSIGLDRGSTNYYLKNAKR